jgi:hypothetical protein
VVIGYVDNDAYNSTYAKNPFNFKHYNLTQIKVFLDGQQQHIKSLEPNFVTNQTIRAYMSLFSGTGKPQRGEGNDIAREDYSGGYTLYAFDLTPDLAEEGRFNLSREGSVRVDLKFAAALPNTINVIAYA